MAELPKNVCQYLFENKVEVFKTETRPKLNWNYEVFNFSVLVFGFFFLWLFVNAFAGAK